MTLRPANLPLSACIQTASFYATNGLRDNHQRVFAAVQQSAKLIKRIRMGTAMLYQPVVLAWTLCMALLLVQSVHTA